MMLSLLDGDKSGEKKLDVVADDSHMTYNLHHPIRIRRK